MFVLHFANDAKEQPVNFSSVKYFASGERKAGVENKLYCPIRKLIPVWAHVIDFATFEVISPHMVRNIGTRSASFNIANVFFFCIDRNTLEILNNNSSTILLHIGNNSSTILALEAKSSN